ncbi:MAG: glycosyltransferase family 4 protein [Bacteroidales bacterium]|nr:glycosyltransferase family 4 protein [Bacteroidales bacterium]
MRKNKHVWIVNYYTTPPAYVSNERHLKFASYLQRAGYRVTIFSASYLREVDLDLIDDSSLFKRVKYGEYNFVHIKVKCYQDNGLARMFSIFQFAWRLLRNRKKFENPDVILHNMHAPFDYLVSTCAKKMKAKYIAEEWDLWPEYFVTFGLISAKNPVMKWAYSKERKMFERGDDIVFSFAGGWDYLKGKGWTKDVGGKIDKNKVHYINNGVSIRDFNENKNIYTLNDPDIENENIFKIVYLGSIRLVNDIKQLIDSVALLKDEKDIQLLIYGDGDQRDALMRYCLKNSIDNVIFKEKRIPLSHVPYVLSHSNLNILNYQKGFGDHGISSGKLFQSLAAGKPLVCNIKIAYDDVITDNQLGIAENLDTPQKYADAVLKIYNLNKKEYEEMCARVREVAKRFDYEILSNKLLEIVKKYS